MKWLRSIVVLICLSLLTTTLMAVPLPRRDWLPEPESPTPRVVLDTNYGRITVELFADRAPITVKNFLQYVDEQHYDGSVFHRVIADFMIQGGGYEPGLKEKKTRPPIKNEAANGLSNERGTLSAARTNVPDSATAQFFINSKDNKFLDRANSHDKVGYAVFGKVVEGMEVVDEIRRVATGQVGALSDVPTQDVVIRSIRRMTK